MGLLLAPLRECRALDPACPLADRPEVTPHKPVGVPGKPGSVPSVFLLRGSVQRGEARPDGLYFSRPVQPVLRAPAPAKEFTGDALGQFCKQVRMKFQCAHPLAAPFVRELRFSAGASPACLAVFIPVPSRQSRLLGGRAAHGGVSWARFHSYGQRQKVL